MKLKFKYLQFAIIVLLCSCSSSDDSSSKDKISSEFLTVKVNQENFVVESFSAELTEYNVSDEMVISAMSANGDAIYI